MRKETRIAYNAYLAQLAKINDVGDVTEKFTVDPSVQQTLETKIQESSAFLQKINIVGVPEKAGEKLGLGIGSTIASRTNTATTDRAPADPTSLDKDGYDCAQTNFDTYLTYGKLDLWAKFPDFQTRVRDAILTRQALDRIMIGFNGVSRAATTDRAENPLLQDVNIGWLQKYRANAAARVLDHGGNAGEVRVGSAAGNDYVNLDALVMDCVASLIEPWFRQDPGLVAIIGRGLLHDKYFPQVNSALAPTEQVAMDYIISQKRVGGLAAGAVPFIPDDAILITTLDNLSLYWQEGTRRRTIVDNAKRDRIENYESSNEDYVVEDYGRGCLIENIVQTWA